MPIMINAPRWSDTHTILLFSIAIIVKMAIWLLTPDVDVRGAGGGLCAEI